MNIEDLIIVFETRARRAWKRAETEKDPMGKRLIEHGAVCTQNCASELKECLASISPQPLNTQKEAQK